MNFLNSKTESKEEIKKEGKKADLENIIKGVSVIIMIVFVLFVFNQNKSAITEKVNLDEKLKYTENNI